MLVNKAYKYRLKLTSEQQAQCESFAGHGRWLSNKFLEINLLRLRNKQPIMLYYEMDFFCKLLKHSEEYGFLKEAPAHCLQQKLKDLERAFLDCFDKEQPGKRLPTKRKKNLHDSFFFPEPKQIELDNNRIKLPKLGWVKFFKSQDVIGEIKNVTVSKEAGQWYIAICVQIELTHNTPLSNTAVGVDLGVNNFVALSTGELIASVNAYEVYNKKIVALQRKLAKQQKFSSNWNKTVGKLNKLHHKIANIRHDFINKLTTYLCKSHARVVVEDLKIKHMTKSAKGTIDKPGKNVKAKSGLNRSILSLGWGEFLRKLGYKLAWAGGKLIKVSPHFTSQRCSQCGHIAKANRKTQAEFCCIKCGHTQHADINAAINVLTAAGLAVKACGADAKSVVSCGTIDSMAMKQEPNHWPTIG